MESPEFLEICRRLMRHPAAAYHEHAVRAEAEAISSEAGLRTRRDRYGNLLVELKTARKLKPMVLSAHLDHPGFEITRTLGRQRWLARFRGGVPDEYFTPGLKIRLMPGGASAILGERAGTASGPKTSKGKPPEKLFEISSGLPYPDGQAVEFAVWEMADFRHRGDQIIARACDDLIGVSSILATLIELKRSRSSVHVIGAITRAEEVGFHGALALAAEGGIPKNSFVVSLETSKELPGVKMGKGVILRVGDKASIFESGGTRFLAEVAEDLKKTTPGFSYQRGLMSGGTCEATAYQELGYRAVAVCVALGNYHNCGPANQIRAEYVSLADALSMVHLLSHAARELKGYDGYVSRLRERLHGLLKEAKRDLPGTA